MKPLKPSMKENKRYLFVRGKNLRENVERAIFEFGGNFLMSKAGMSFIESDIKKNSAVISVNREAVNSVRASLCVFPEKIEVLRVSGTLKGLRKKN